MSIAAQQVAAPESTSTSTTTHQFTTRYAAKQRLKTMGMPHAVIRKVESIPAVHAYRGDHPDRHVLCPVATAHALFTCPQKQAEFLQTNWEHYFSKSCKPAIAAMRI